MRLVPPRQGPRACPALLRRHTPPPPLTPLPTHLTRPRPRCPRTPLPAYLAPYRPRYRLRGQTSSGDVDVLITRRDGKKWDRLLHKVLEALQARRASVDLPRSPLLERAASARSAAIKSSTRPPRGWRSLRHPRAARAAARPRARLPRPSRLPPRPPAWLLAARQANGCEVDHLSTPEKDTLQPGSNQSYRGIIKLPGYQVGRHSPPLAAAATAQIAAAAATAQIAAAAA